MKYLWNKLKEFFQLASVEDVEVVTQLLVNVINQGESIMATIKDLQDAVASEAMEVKNKIDALEDEIIALKASVSNGGTITETQLDDVLVSVQNIFTPTSPAPTPDPVI